MAEGSPRGQVEELLRVLKRRRWQIALPAILVTTLGVAFAVIVPKKYVVDTRIEVRESRNPADYQLRNPQETATAREIPNVEQHVKHYGRVVEIIESRPKLWPEYLRADAARKHEIIETVLRNIEVDVLAKDRSEGSTFVDMAYRDVDAQRAQEFLQDLRDAWVADVVDRELNTLKREAGVLQDQVQEATERFSEADQRYADLARQMGINPAEPLDARQPQAGQPRDWYFENLDEVRTQRVEVEELLAQARTRQELLQRRYDEEPDEVWVREALEGRFFADQIAELDKAITALLEQQAAYTPAHSRYRQLERQIARLELEKEELRDQESEGEVREQLVPNQAKAKLEVRLAEQAQEVERLVADAARLRQRLEDSERETQRRAVDYRTLTSLRYERELSRARLEELKAELDQKHDGIEVMLEAYGKPYEIVKPALAEDAPSEPNPALIVVFSLLLGLALGLALALLAEYGGNSYRTVADLAAVMTVPVLGAVGHIVTRAEERRARLRRWTVGLSTAVIVLGVGWMTWTWYATPERLPVQVLRAIESFQLMMM